MLFLVIALSVGNTSLPELLTHKLKATYVAAKPVAELEQCLLLNATSGETRVVHDGIRTIIGYSVFNHFQTSLTLTPTDTGTVIEQRGSFGEKKAFKTCAVSPQA